MFIIFESFLTTFEASSIVWGSWGSDKNWLEPNHHNQVKLVQICDTLCSLYYDVFYSSLGYAQFSLLGVVELLIVEMWCKITFKNKHSEQTNKQNTKKFDQIVWSNISSQWNCSKKA